MPPKNASAYQGARHYEWKGRKLPSVTTILQSYPKPWLGAWAAVAAALMAHLVLPNGSTMQTWAAKQLPAAFRDGVMPPLQLTGGKA